MSESGRTLGVDAKELVMNRKTAGGVVLGAIVLGILLGQFWKIPGLGVNDPNSSNSKNTDAEERPTDNPPADSQVNVSMPVLSESPTSPSGTEEMLTVVIYGAEYRLTRSDDPETGIDMPLSEFVARAKQTTGNANGIRVRILLHESAQEGARFDLLSALKEAGLKPEQVQEVSEFVR